MAAPMSIILPIAFAQATASFEPGLMEYRLEFQGTSFMNGYAAFESLAAASPISSANAGAQPSAATAPAAAEMGTGRNELAGGGTNVRCRAVRATTPATTSILPCATIALLLVLALTKK